MNDDFFLSTLRDAHEPTSHLLFECEAMLSNTDSDSRVNRLIGLALDRWGISKEEMQIRNRLAAAHLNEMLESMPLLQLVEDD